MRHRGASERCGWAGGCAGRRRRRRRGSTWRSWPTTSACCASSRPSWRTPRSSPCSSTASCAPARLSLPRDKYEMGWGSSVVYFLWNLFLLCPRILALALFALLWPYAVAVHFPLVWLAMFLWVTLQGTDFMESPGPEQLYRAVVAVILYFSWFNVAPGRTLHRTIIYHGFILVDSTLLTLAWLWGRPPEEQRPYLVPVLCAALLCYLLGLLLRVAYYGWLHPNVRARPRSSCDEVDAEGRAEGVVEFRSISEPDLVNPRLRCLARSHFPLSALAEPRLLNGAAAV
ncbi:XK-related protein 8 isoform X1 [Numida meleagris]|uniref:XK-related protein 8 isoform X1 n=1 Tax=Numida meleagris TaxID=8996 RepID=UPI000B3D82BC|nr:XK-related protein 8 isoform X1 [Numida meleagris]